MPRLVFGFAALRDRAGRGPGLRRCRRTAAPAGSGAAVAVDAPPMPCRPLGLSGAQRLARPAHLR